MTKLILGYPKASDSKMMSLPDPTELSKIFETRFLIIARMNRGWCNVSKKLTLGIYMPSFGRSALALKSVREIRYQIDNLKLELITLFKVEVSLAVNSDPDYSQEDFDGSVDYFVNRSVNLGGDLNIGLGFSESISNKWDYLWIVGDDEPLGENAVEVILETISESNPDLIVGSKGSLIPVSSPDSFQDLNRIFSGTLTFISSCVYKCNYSKEMIEKCLDFAFTSYTHVCMQNLLIQNKMLELVFPVEMQLLCDYHYKVLQDPLKPRREYSYRDSRVFFGKILTPIITNDENYIRSEFSKWWKANWHRFSMYADTHDFRSDLVFGYSIRFPSLYPWLVLSLLPYWRLKEVLRPVPSTRILGDSKSRRWS